MYLLGFGALPALSTTNKTGATVTTGTRLMTTTGSAKVLTCPATYTKQDSVCISPGCISGRENCVVIDTAGRQCSYDQMLNAWQNTGVKQCPAPGGPQEESGHFVMPGTPGSVPIPGTQAMPSPLPLPVAPIVNPAQLAPQAQLVSSAATKRKLLWVALGLGVVGGIFALTR